MSHSQRSQKPATNPNGHEQDNGSGGWRQWLGESVPGLGVLHGIATGSDWDQVQAEVNEEMVGQVALVGLVGAGKTTLLHRLRDQPMVESAPQSPLAHEGFFTLLDLPAADDDEEAAFSLLDELQGVNLALYLVDATAGLRPGEMRWISHLRSQGTPLLPVLSKADGVPDPVEMAAALRNPLALRPVPVSCVGAQDGLGLLVQRILDVQPRLAIPLAREAPLARPIVTQRVVRQSVVVSAMLGAEPIPFLDLPLQVANHLRLALRLGAVYGQPGMDFRSRELMATLGTSLGARYLMQQVLRLIPVVGWGASALLGGVGTWLLGRSLAAYYEAGWEALSGRELLARANPAPQVEAHVIKPVQQRLHEMAKDHPFPRLALPSHHEPETETEPSSVPDDPPASSEEAPARQSRMTRLVHSLPRPFRRSPQPETLPDASPSDPPSSI